MSQITTRSKYGQQHFEVFDKCLGWLLAFMQHLLHSVWSSTVVIGTLRPSLSSGRPYQCMCYLPCVCIVITLLWCGVVFLADGGSWHFVPPPNPNCSVYFYLFIFSIYRFTSLFMFSSTQPSGSCVTVLIGRLVQDVSGWIAG